MTVNFRGYVFQDDGDAVNGATVQLLETGTTTVEASTTTDSDGLWYFNEADQDRYDVKITSGTSVRYVRWDDQVSFKEIDVRNNTGATTPAATFSNLTNSTANQVAVFSGANSTKADNDEIYISFKMHDSAGNLDEFARMTAVATDVTSGSEDGQIEFDVIKAGTLTKVWTITSSTGAAMSFDMNVDALTIGSGADTDVSLTFDANSADGVITWMEDEDYFKFSDDILMNSTERINFYDTAIYIYSSTDGQLDLVADTEIQIAATTIDINGAVALNGAITGATNITLSGELDAATLDISGNADIDGTTNLDAVDIDGAVQIDATFTSGVDGQGYDTKFFGDTASAYIMWDTSADKLLTAGGAVIDIVKDKLLIGSTAVTTTAAELNVLDNVTAGTVTASLGVVVDSNKDIGTFRNITLSGELDAATLDLSSSADIAGDLVLSGGADGALQFTNAGENSIKIPDNQASALIIEEADNAYITFVTTNSSEAITVAKATTFSSTISAATGSTIGNLTLANGSITDSGGALDFGNETLTTTGAVDFGAATVDSLSVSDANITNVGDIALDTISSDGSTVTVSMDDNTDLSFSVKEGSNEYMVFDTTDGTEGIGIGRGPTNSSRLLVDWPDITTSANTYIKSNFRGNNGAVTLGGNMATMATVGIHEPNVTLNSNTLTNAASLYIGSVATEASFNHAIIVDAGTSRFDDSIFIGDNANAQVELGLTINMGASDKQAFALKSSDVNHALLTGLVANETDTYFAIAKMDGASGGANLQCFAGDASHSRVLGMTVAGGTANTDQTAADGQGLVDFYITEHDGANALTDIADDGNLLAVRGRSGGSTKARFIVTGNGNLYADGTLGAFDSFDDAHLVRAFDIAQNSKDLIKSEWDNFLKYGEDKLVELGILGDTIENGGLINVTGLQRLHNGAIWQGYVRQQELQERVEELETKLLALEGAK